MSQVVLTREDVASIEMPPASSAYLDRTTSMVKRLADMVTARGISRGTLSLNIARKVDPSARLGQQMTIAGAEFTVVP